MRADAVGVRPYVDIHDIPRHVLLRHFKLPTSSKELLKYCGPTERREVESRPAPRGATTQGNENEAGLAETHARASTACTARLATTGA